MTRQGVARIERLAVPVSKVRAPVAPTTLVPRGRLLRLLERNGVGPDVTLVSGPAGCGKTTLLAACARRLSASADLPGTPHLAWVTLDVQDNDVCPLWSAILAALEGTGAWGPNAAIHRISPPRGTMENGFLAAIASTFDELSAPVWLILDDLHQLHDQATIRSLDMLLRNTPKRLRLILAGRYEPPLSLPRLRLEGRLREIGAEQLAFTREEACRLLARHRIRLDDADIDVVMDRTEGWAAGLRFAVLSLNEAAEPETVVQEFAGDDRVVADYLAGEILSPFPEHIRQFLLAISVCNEVTVDLAARLSGRADAGEILHRLAQANALIVRLRRQGEWYRCHVLLRDYLRAELRRRHPEARHGFHRVASAWFEDHDAPVSALRHAVAAEDPDGITRLVRTYGLRLLMAGEGSVLRRVLDGVPDKVARQPTVALVVAAAALDAGEIATADVRLAQLEVQPTGYTETWLRTLYAAVTLERARRCGSVARAGATLTTTETVDTGDPDLDLFALASRGSVNLWLGQYHDAEQDLLHATQLAISHGRDYLALQCMSQRAALAGATGDLVEMSARVARALDFAEPRGWASTSNCGYAYVLGSWLAYQRLDDESAHRQVSLALETLVGRTDATAELMARALAAAISFEGAENKRGVLAALRAHRVRLGEERVSPQLLAMSLPLEQRMALRLGEVGWASEAMACGQRLLGTSAESRLLRALMYAHNGRVQPARNVLGPILRGELWGFVLTVVDAWLLEASLSTQVGDARRAHNALCEALRLATPQRLLRPFVDAGLPVRNLLAAGSGRFGQYEGFATEALAAIPPHRPGPCDLLTWRELQMLRELPAMRTVDEIAAALFVSVNTVKTHLRTIYRKLGVHTRRDAVVAARELGLL